MTKRLAPYDATNPIADMTFGLSVVSANRGPRLETDRRHRQG